jgi:hypothetical protein
MAVLMLKSDNVTTAECSSVTSCANAKNQVAARATVPGRVTLNAVTR